MIDIRHTGIVVADMGKAIHFYRDLLGLKIVAKKEEGGQYIKILLDTKNAGVTTVKLAAVDNSLVELLHFKSARAKPLRRKIDDPGYTHISFTVRNIQSEYERLKQEKVIFVSAPQTSPDGKAKIAFCCDPEGNFIELVEEVS